MKLHPRNILRANRKATAAAARPQAKRQQGKPASGMALVLVLAFLVIITGLVLAFFSTVTTELAGAKSYANEATTKQLADSTAQIAIAAIKQATSGAAG